jgi:hypothetical protein
MRLIQRPVSLGGMIRTFRLTNESGGLGLSCTSDGLSLAGVPLLQRTEAGFAPRPAPEIVSLMQAAYGADSVPTRLQPSLDGIAEALNRGDLTRATIAAVLTRTPELRWEAAARLAQAEEKLTKYDPGQPRDWHGRWTADGAGGPASTAAPAQEGAFGQDAELINPHFTSSEQDVADRNALLTPVAFTVPDESAGGDGSQDPAPLEQEFESKYDDLGPVEFAKEVIEFGSWLEREGKNLSPAEKERALAEYSFLQDRLSFWLGYNYKPPIAQGNLISAALTLYQGAVNGGIVGVRDLPQSMLDVAGAAWAVDAAPGFRASTKPSFENEPIAPAEPVSRETAPQESAPHEPAPQEPTRQDIEGLGGFVSKEEVGIEWNKGIHDQGGKWQIWVGKQIPDATELPPGSKTFDHFNEVTGEAISDKSLNTLSVSYIRYPQRILSKLKGYVNAAADYDRPRAKFDLDPADIRSRTIQLSIPAYTSPTQWRYLNSAILYGRERGVTIVVTRIRE